MWAGSKVIDTDSIVPPAAEPQPDGDPTGLATCPNRTLTMAEPFRHAASPDVDQEQTPECD